MTSSDDCARHVLDVVPLVVRAIRTEMRRHRGANLSVPQFRSLAYVSRETGASLSDVAQHVGLTLPSMSRMIDGLVRRRLVCRRTSARDRRRVTLALSALGRATLRTARSRTQARVAETLGVLSEDERASVIRAMRALRPAFDPSRRSEEGGRRREPREKVGPAADQRGRRKVHPSFTTARGEA